MNTLINELKEVLVNNNIKNSNNGVKQIEEYFTGFEVHPLKEEWLVMTKKEKHQFVQKLLKPIEQPVEQPKEEVSEELTLEQALQEEQEGKQDLINIVQQDIKEIQEEIQELQQQLQPLQQQLNELLGINNESKMVRARRYFKENKDMSRKDMLIHFVDEIGLTKAGSATYYNIFRTDEKNGK